MCPEEAFIVYPISYPHLAGFTGTIALVDIRRFYKIVFVVSGSCTIAINARLVELSAGDIIFLRPGDRLFIDASEKARAYVCLVQSAYLATHSHYLVDLFSHFPLYVFHQAIIALNKKQSEIVQHSFESIMAEQKSKNCDKKEATALHLQMIMLQIKRAGRKVNCLEFPGAGAFSHPFPLSACLQ